MADSKSKTLFEDKAQRLVWNPETGVIESIALRHMSGPEFRAAMERLLVFLREKRARKCLGDLGNAGNIAPEDLLWAEADWFARARTTGVKVFAIVMPKSLSGHLAVDKLIDNKEFQARGLVRMVCQDAESAREWIVKQ